MALKTQDILGVDLLAAGGPYHGTGSPTGGDFYTDEDLARIAADTSALLASGELRIPVKLGHSKEQKLLRASGFTDGEMPAAGWVTNVRAEGNKLRGDLMRVPDKLADLIGSGAFRTRSVELRSITSQQGGGTRGAVVSGLAWLGAKAPAVRSLDDVVALYSDQEEEDGVTIVTYGDDNVWNPDWGYRAIQSAIHTGLAQVGEFQVIDVGPDRALVSEGEVTWVIPFTAGDTVELAERGEWVLGQPEWARVADVAIQMCESGSAADTSNDMEITLSTEQVTAFAEKLGIDPETFTVDAAVEKVDEIRALAEKTPDEGTVSVPQEEFAALVANGAKLKTFMEDQAAAERDRLLDAAVVDGRINPGDLSKWVVRYDDNPVLVTEILSEIPTDDSYAREFGRSESASESETLLADAFDAYMGVETVGEGR